jgi:peroxisomal membrane protein 4
LLSVLIAWQDQLEKVILDPKYHQPLVLLKAIRNGLVYGTKVRFPHALVMVFLFRSNTPIREKLLLIFKATRQHAMNLARFALLYKSGMLALKSVNGGKEESIHSFLAGLFGGYWVFGHGKGASSSVNQQIVIYVFARVVLGLAKLAVQPPGDNSLVGGSYGGHGGKGLLGLSESQLEAVRRNSWPVFASMSWASVMWLFRYYPETLQPSLRSSMTYMYVLLFLSVPLMLRLLHFLPLTRGLTSRFSFVDTRMRRLGIAQEISFGITSDPVFTLHSVALLGRVHTPAYPHIRPQCCTICWRAATDRASTSFANSEHWLDLRSYVYTYKQTIPPGLPAKLD